MCTLIFSVAKGKGKSILVRLVSAAGTGYFYTMRRNRTRAEKLILMKHDPVVNKHVLFVETKVKKGK